MKGLSIFISSTFHDMGFERDCLNRFIIPMLNEKYNSLGYDITAIDLRWGIFSKENDSELEREQNILKTCFEVIDNSEPFFVSFIGNRHGWIPEISVIKELPYINSETKAQLLSYHIDKPSVTALEIIYGVFHKENYSKSLIFTKDTDTCCDPHVIQLRNLIVNKYKDAGLEDNIVSYSVPFNKPNAKDIDVFVHDISSQLSRIIDNYLETSKETSLVKKKLELPYYWVKYQRVSEIISSFISGNDIIVYGEEGSGKTCLSKYIYNQLADDDQNIIFFHSVGETADSFDEKEMIYRWSDKIKPGDSLPRLSSIEKEWKRFCDLLKLRGYNAKIVIDSLDRLPIIPTKMMMFFGVSNIQYLITSHNRLPMWEKFLRVRPILLKGFNREESIDVIQCICQNNAKNITPEIIHSILDNRQNEDGYYSPLDIVTLLSFMNQLDDSVFAKLSSQDSMLTERGITEYLTRLSRNTSLRFEDLCLKLSDELVKYFGPGVLDPYYYIAYSINGFTDIDLANILGDKFNPISFHLSRQYLSSLITKRNEMGRWLICNNSLKNMLKSMAPAYVLEDLSKNRYLREDCAYYAIISNNHDAFFNTFIQYGQRVLQSCLAAYRLLGAKRIVDFILEIQVRDMNTMDELFSFLLFDLTNKFVFLDLNSEISYWETINSYFTTKSIDKYDSWQRFVGRSFEGLGDAYVKAYKRQNAMDCYNSALTIYEKYNLSTQYILCKSKLG